MMDVLGMEEMGEYSDVWISSRIVFNQEFYSMEVSNQFIVSLRQTI